MKILVAVKQVASLDEDFEIRADGKEVEAEFLIRDLNEWDDYSLEEAVKIKEAAGAAAGDGTASGVEVVAVTVGPQAADEALRKCLAKGADRAIRIWSEEIHNSDAVAIARILAAAIRREQPQLVLAGVQSSDQACAATGMAVAGFLGWAHVAVVNQLIFSPGTTRLEIRRELEGGLSQIMEIDAPAVLTIQLGINTPRYASLRSIKQAAAKVIELVTPTDLGVAPSEAGETGSLSRVRRMYKPEKGRAQMIEGTLAEQAAKLAALVKEFKGAAV